MEDHLLRSESFAPTGGRLQVTERGVIRLTLGERRASNDAEVAEAHWCEDQFRQLRAAYPQQAWTAIVDLSRVPDDRRPPKGASEVYTHLLRDDSIAKVALVHATTVQKAIVTILLAPTFFSDRVHFFANLQSAEDWVGTEHVRGDRVRW